MSKTRVLFVDRDGTLIEEPPDEQVDSIEKIRFMPGVFAALRQAQRAGYKLAMITNQDGLGSESFPQAAFDVPHQFMMDAFSSQDIEFDAVFVCPHRKSDGCDCRKPKTKLVEEYIRNVDLAGSAMVGDRETDMEFARNLGTRGLLVRRHGNKWETWPSILRELTERRATIRRTTKETDIHVTVNLDTTAPITIATGIGFFDHMLEQIAKHGGFSLELKCHGDLDIDEHHTVEDCALALGETLRMALGDKVGIARYGFVLPMDEAQVRVAIDLSGPRLRRVRRQVRARSRRRPADRVGASLLQVAGRESQGGDPCHHHRRKHAPHDRSLLQGCRPHIAPGVSPRK